MSEHLSGILDKALARLEAGERVEDILADHPSQRDDLSQLLMAAQGLSLLRAAPRTPSEAGLATFLDQARAVQAEAARTHHRWKWLAGRLDTFKDLCWEPRTRLVVGPLLAFVMLLALMAGMIALAADSLPGDLLYPVKLTAEELRLSFSADVSDRIQRHLSRARARSEEIQRLSEAGRPISEVTLLRMRASLEATLLAAASADVKDAPSLLAAAREVAARQEALLFQLEATAANAQQRRLIGQARLILSQTVSLARAGQSNPYGFHLDAKSGFPQLGSASPLP